MAKPRLVLGSASPRRLALLRQIHVTPDIIQGADIDETPRKNELPQAYCLRMALEKNAALVETFPDDFIITADTSVAVGRRIIGKPADRDEAKKIIQLLSGRAHHIITSLAIRAPDGRCPHRLTINRMKVKNLSDAEIEEYLDTNDWDDVAGAYRLQGVFARYSLTISGSPSGIMGLPLYETTQLLKGLGYFNGNET